MITRRMQKRLIEAAGRNAVVTLTGPRQSGKTTLCSMAFPDLPLVSLERPDTRDFALQDPITFLERYPKGAVFDEIQRAPALTSYIQGIVDGDPSPGRFVLTGSNNFRVMEAVSQSLAGRTAILELLPLELGEVASFGRPSTGLFEMLHAGAFPAMHDRRPPVDEWLGSYVMTYVERDVRQVTNVGNLVQFQSFMRLAAGRSGSLLNLAGLGADCGITHNTARSWLSVLEASYLVTRLPPWAGGITSRLVKSHKPYFVDSGLACYLLGIGSAKELEHHPLRGQIFEGWVVMELQKRMLNAGRRPEFFFYRDAKGFEIDLLFRSGEEWNAVEIKSGSTVAGDWVEPLLRFERTVAPKLAGGLPLRKSIVYGGEDAQMRHGCRVVPWNRVEELFEE